MAVINITNQNYQEEVLKADKTVLMDFWASWCGPCQMLSPVVDALAEEREDIKVVKVNTDEVPLLAQGIQSDVYPYPGGNEKWGRDQPFYRCDQ